MVTSLLSFIVALAAGLVCTPVALAAARRWGVVDAPDGCRKLQGCPVPLLGGLGVSVGWWLGLGLVLAGNVPLHLPAVTVPAGFTLALLTLVGVTDDIWGLRARWKLSAQVLAVLPIVLSGCGLHEIAIGSWTCDLGIWGAPATVLWLIVGINAVNLIDGMDGMAAVTSLGVCLSIAAVDLLAGSGHVAPWILALAGAMAGFLVFNFPPAKIYLGDAGSMVIGLAVALSSLLVARVGSSATHLTWMLALLALPLADLLLAIARRTLSGRSIWIPDRQHIHHRLLDLGWRPRQVLALSAVVGGAWGALVALAAASHNEALLWIAALTATVLAVRWRLAGDREWALASNWLHALAFGPVRPAHAPIVALRFDQSEPQLPRTWARATKGQTPAATRSVARFSVPTGTTTSAGAASGHGGAHARELAAGQRFEFGRNWQRFLNVLDEGRIAAAEAALCEKLDCQRLDGLTFLDVGSGSGLSSLAARRLGARVHSFDYDPQSVACTRALRDLFFPDDPLWTIEEGSALDADYLRSLPKFDIVYSWGVLHHTGAMWQALDNILLPLADKGRLVVAIYNTLTYLTPLHTWLKRSYVKSPALGKWLIAGGYIAGQVGKGLLKDVLLLRNPLARYRNYRSRGMSRWHDWIDWVGGYPFETAGPDEIFNFYRQRGLVLDAMLLDGGLGCNEFVLSRSSVAVRQPERLLRSAA